MSLHIDVAPLLFLRVASVYATKLGMPQMPPQQKSVLIFRKGSMEKKITLSLSLEETNIVVSALAKQPYDLVFKLIENIRRQAEPQIKEQEQSTES